jgi:hypothetical protein
VGASSRNIEQNARLNSFSVDEPRLLLKAGYSQAEAAIRVDYAAGAGLSQIPGTTPPSPSGVARSARAAGF